MRESIEAQGKWTPALEQALAGAQTLAEVEDIYRPYRPKRKTRASIARERGLEPLAKRLFAQRAGDDPAALAAGYLSDETPDAEAALAGARDIIAEALADSASVRAALRGLYRRTARLVSRAAKPEEKSVYEGYYEYEEPVAKIAGHRVLAVDRGERDGFLKVRVAVE